MSILVFCDAVCAISIFLPSSQFMTDKEGETTDMGTVCKTFKERTMLIAIMVRFTCLWAGWLRPDSASTSMTSVLSNFSRRGWVGSLENVGILKKIYSGGGREERSFFRGGDVTLLRNGSHQIRPGLLAPNLYFFTCTNWGFIFGALEVIWVTDSVTDG